MRRSRLLFTFAEGDLAVVRPFAERLRMSGDALSIDFSLTSEPFSAQRADYIRASLAVRVRRSLATVCLYGPQTFADDWVLWTLETAYREGRPIVGTPLTVAPLPDALDLFAALGAAVVPPKPELFKRHLASIDEQREPSSAVAEAAALTLHAMHHPLR